MKPSSLYTGGLWQAALRFTRVLGRGADPMVRIASAGYGRLNARRRAIVRANLLPVLGNDVASANRATDRLFRNFGQKLVDLWRYEAGNPVDSLVEDASEWERFAEARSRGGGVLLVTPHLGNWEFGAPLLAKKGVPLVVLTAEEPETSFTQMRNRARAKWGIETIVVGKDPFAFVQVIRRLEEGAAVALLVDRPAAASSTEVELFGRPFRASIAAAELARATGCAIVPVILPRVGNVYHASVLPCVEYERRALRDREMRQRLTQDMMRAFEPAIRQYVDQWYHFVPVW